MAGGGGVVDVALFTGLSDVIEVFRPWGGVCSCWEGVSGGVGLAGVSSREKMTDCSGNRFFISWNSITGEWWAIWVSNLVVLGDGFAYEEIWPYRSCKIGSQATRSK